MGSSPRATAAADASQAQAALLAQLAGIGLPEIQNIGGMVTGQLQGGMNAIPPDIQQAFAPIQAQMNQDFAQAGVGNAAAIRQRAKQSGMPFSSEQLSDATTRAALDLEGVQNQANAQLQMTEASAGLEEFNTLMNLLGGGAQTALGFGQGAGGLATGALGGMSNSNPWGSAIAGAASGALAGSVVPGVGTAVGAIGGGLIGGIGGYFGGGG